MPEIRCAQFDMLVVGLAMPAEVDLAQGGELFDGQPRQARLLEPRVHGLEPRERVVSRGGKGVCADEQRGRKQY